MTDLTMTQREFGPDGQEFGSATHRKCPNTWPAALKRKRKNRNVTLIPDGFEFDTYPPGYWDIQASKEDAEYLNGLRTRVTFH